MLSKEALKIKKEIIRSPEVDTIPLDKARKEWDDFCLSAPLAKGVIREETLIHVGDHEILLDDSLRLGDKMKSDQVEVTLKVWPELWHCFHMWHIPEADRALDEISDFILKDG